MKFILNPSLEHMTLVKIVISLWSQIDVRILIVKHSSEFLCSKENWKTIEERVIENVSQLSLPQPLKEKVFSFIRPIGLELLEWIKYHDRYYTRIDIFFIGHNFNLPTPLPVELCWTPYGTVERKRTAEVLVTDENLDITRRYILACDYCLEGDIIRLWNNLPENVKDYEWNKYPVVSFWSDNLKRGGVGHMSYEDVFYSSVFSCNKVAAKYFLQKLTPLEREEFFEELSENMDNVDVLCFLLPDMEEEEQKSVIKIDPHRVLRCFLQWPWQSFFVGVANAMWDCISKEDYCNILKEMICKVSDGYKDCDYQQLFREFWQESPIALKSLITNEIHKSWLLSTLFCIKDKEIIKIIFKDANQIAKEKLIYSNRMKNFCEQSILANEWGFLKFCIRECFSSKNEMLKFKEEFEKYMMHSYFKEHFATKKPEWDQLFHFSDDAISEYVKRSVEEAESSSSKRFKNLQ